MTLTSNWSAVAMTNFRIVDQRIQEKVTEELSEIITESMGAILGGAFFAQRTLEMAKGDQAANLLGRISPIGNTVEVIKEISEMEPGKSIISFVTSRPRPLPSSYPISI